MTEPLLQNPEKLQTRLKEIPLEAGVYFMRDRHDGVIYIGKSKALRNRVRSYFRSSQDLSPRIAMMVQLVHEIEFIVTDSEAEALALEANLIKQYQPYYNVLLKDDKKYPYVCITWSEDYPRIFITRKRRMGGTKDKYYGPYVDVFNLKRTLGIIKRAFPLRQRPIPMFKDRPCLNYDMGLCPGVCQEKVSPEDYRKTMLRVAMIFQGRSSELVESFTEKMEVAAEALEFEKAADLRDRIQVLQNLNSNQKVSLPDDTVSRDAIALAYDEQHTCIQLFQIRAGRLVGRLAFVADSQSDQPEAILQRTLEAHYQNCDPVEIPNEVHTQLELPEVEILQAWLSDRKGRKVAIATPQRQLKAELIEMVERNAQYELARIQKQSDRNLQGLEDLAELLNLDSVPHRIEGYDISHIQGSDAVASQVVFIDGIPAKQHYRHYKIRNPDIKSGHSDDFASLAEVIARRFRKYAAFEVLTSSHSNLGEGDDTLTPSPSPKGGEGINSGDDFPDVVMIDGGKGQLSSVMKIIDKLGLRDRLTVISLAKKREEIFLPEQSEPLVGNDPERAGVQVLRRLRDEAHRFAITFHRQKRSQRMQRSHLDQITGLGHHRQKVLLEKFHSVEYIRQATVEQIAETEGIGKKLALHIYNHFHPTSS
ncbi:excinuclease ABC subunit UvrC [Pseudanabaena sp. FACHB-1998]|uniref:excinuclease ABC subunit UvrC n=1 Tax=Pseudanabaena sp. FACHB-1998 TaxID=2692858 RepID=UPI0016812E04|nr:excinuclease ABC subunit UvrC [Pseudanabaena sp. FACHB-1998]MBD2176374.1 excinuclease ABC subunit UvrC [Pseudanabaena sp. FACHB-1998]